MSSHPSERPTWTSAGSLQAVLLGLASGGVCLAAASPRRRCALTAPFHPCRRAAHVWPRAEAVSFCGTFPRVSPGRCRRPPCPVMSGLSSKANLRGCLACTTDSSAPAPPAPAVRPGAAPSSRAPRDWRTCGARDQRRPLDEAATSSASGRRRGRARAPRGCGSAPSRRSPAAGGRGRPRGRSA